ncbi:helix-turn-helix domain-containing protein [Brevibacterium sp.]|uniref:helix-turn-helix domain-containing protein n=1 Tax=Brevibacterium sp. TaxID=1701 RepID=UPI0035C7B613
MLQALRDDDATIHQATESRKAHALSAYRRGIPKARIATAGGITRQTLDNWIARAGVEQLPPDAAAVLPAES